jgi:hypothetical protein
MLSAATTPRPNLRSCQFFFVEVVRVVLEIVFGQTARGTPKCFCGNLNDAQVGSDLG